VKTSAKHILLGVTGSIAAYKAADLVRRLQDKGFRVSVMMTKEAEQFITPLTLSSLSGEPVYRQMFDQNEEAWKMAHIQLAKLDLFLIAPATANIIGKLACGIADDLMTCTAITTKAPIVIAPAMNEDMFGNKIVQENLRKLKGFGMKFIEPIKGKLACGVFGEGHLADVDDIVKTVVGILK
jgi:phosphopantothenoylcysteine decarboxylase/phosphopantothenate--cysteine ligase